MRVKYTLLAFMSYIFGGFFLVFLPSSSLSPCALCVYAFWLKFTHTNFLSCECVSLKQSIAVEFADFFSSDCACAPKKDSIKLCGIDEYYAMSNCRQRSHIHTRRVRDKWKVTTYSSAQTKLHNSSDGKSYWNKQK